MTKIVALTRRLIETALEILHVAEVDCCEGVYQSLGEVEAQYKAEQSLFGDAWAGADADLDAARLSASIQANRCEALANAIRDRLPEGYHVLTDAENHYAFVPACGTVAVLVFRKKTCQFVVSESHAVGRDAAREGYRELKAAGAVS